MQVQEWTSLLRKHLRNNYYLILQESSLILLHRLRLSVILAPAAAMGRLMDGHQNVSAGKLPRTVTRMISSWSNNSLEVKTNFHFAGVDCYYTPKSSNVERWGLRYRVSEGTAGGGGNRERTQLPTTRVTAHGTWCISAGNVNLEIINYLLHYCWTEKISPWAWLTCRTQAGLLFLSLLFCSVPFFSFLYYSILVFLFPEVTQSQNYLEPSD